MIVSLSLPFLLGVAGLALEFGNGLLVKVSNQRVADAAAYAGALAYAQSPTQSAIEAAAARVATLNGLPATATVASFGVSPRGNGNNAVQVVVSTSASFLLSRLVGAAPALTVPASSTAEITANAPGCIFAVGPSPATGVTLSGGTSVAAPSCSVASANTVSVPCGTSLTSLTLSYNSAAAPTNGCNSIHGPNNAAPTIVKKAVPDPLAGSAIIATATAHIADVAAMTSPLAPAAPSPPNGPGTISGGYAIDFAYNPSSTQAQAVAAGCTASFSSPTWTLTCPPGNRTFSSITVGGGIVLRFVPLGLPTNVYSFPGAFSISSSGWSFGPGIYRFGGDLSLNGTTFAGGGSWTVGGSISNSYSTASFGNGNLNIVGSISNGGTLSFGAGNVAVGGSLTNNGTMSFGNGSISVVGSLTTSGGGTFSLGSGDIAVGGTMTNGSSGAFSVAGASNVAVRSGIANTGSATMTLPAAAYRIGQGVTNCNGGYYSVCTINGPIVFGGPSSFALSSGVYVAGGSRIGFGGGTGNSFDLGRSSNGYGIAVGGGATLTFADATGASSVFRMNGPINYGSAGGSCLTLPAAAQHDINGGLDAAGGLILGGGTYTINGIVAFGRAGGGAVTCNGKQISVTGTGITFVNSGSNPPAGSCGDFASNWSFCVASGYSGVDLTAPTAGAMAKLLVIGPQSGSSGATFSSGASNANLSGAFYYPKGPVSLGGGAGVGNKPGQCLTLIGTQVSLTGGAVVASACISGATGVAGVVFVR